MRSDQHYLQQRKDGLLYTTMGAMYACMSIDAVHCHQHSSSCGLESAV